MQGHRVRGLIVEDRPSIFLERGHRVQLQVDLDQGSP